VCVCDDEMQQEFHEMRFLVEILGLGASLLRSAWEACAAYFLVLADRPAMDAQYLLAQLSSIELSCTPAVLR